MVTGSVSRIRHASAVGKSEQNNLLKFPRAGEKEHKREKNPDPIWLKLFFHCTKVKVHITNNKKHSQ